MEINNTLFLHIQNKIRKLMRSKFTISILAVLLICSLATVMWIAEQPVIYTDISKYGRYTGTGANDFVRDYIESFFPEQIDDSFSNVRYIYKAAGQNCYDFEAYLEFTIQDTDAFQRYVEGIAPEDAWEVFPYDAGYQIYWIENSFDIRVKENLDPESDLHHPIEKAKIRAVLCNADTQTVIFWALGVYDGGGIGTNFLNTFFSRFEIDPVIYEQTADSPYGHNPFGID